MPSQDSAGAAKPRALILAGGSGTRFWPSSRGDRPKQLLRLGGEESLLRQTVARLEGLVDVADVWICTTRKLADAIAAELPELDSSRILVEPEGRDTAAAIAWALGEMEADASVVCVLPADHPVAEPAAFRTTLGAACSAVAATDRVLTLGVVPSRPETGYGYLELGEVLDDASGLRRVAHFREKPDAETARTYLEGGRHLWNAGIFILRGGRLLELVAEHVPDLAEGLERIRSHPEDLDRLYAELPRISIDYAVMERCDDLATLPLDCGWSDLGSWSALFDVVETTPEGNFLSGDVVAVDASNNCLIGESGTVAVVGVRDLVVVRTEDAVLVVPRERAQDVKKLVEELRRRRRTDLL